MDERSKLAWYILQQVERMLLKYSANASASMGPELVAIEAALREAGHQTTATAEDVRDDLVAATAFDKLVTDLDQMLYEFADGDEDNQAVADLIVDCVRTGDLNTFIRSDYHVDFVFDAMEPEWAASGMLSFLGVLTWLQHYRDRLQEGPLMIIPDEAIEDDDVDDEIDALGLPDDDEDELFPGGFELDGPIFPSEES